MSINNVVTAVNNGTLQVPLNNWLYTFSMIRELPAHLPMWYNRRNRYINHDAQAIIPQRLDGVMENPAFLGDMKCWICLMEVMFNNILNYMVSLKNVISVSEPLPELKLILTPEEIELIVSRLIEDTFCTNPVNIHIPDEPEVTLNVGKDTFRSIFRNALQLFAYPQSQIFHDMNQHDRNELINHFNTTFREANTRLQDIIGTLIRTMTIVSNTFAVLSHEPTIEQVINGIRKIKTQFSNIIERYSMFNIMHLLTTGVVVQPDHFGFIDTFKDLCKNMCNTLVFSNCFLTYFVNNAVLDLNCVLESLRLITAYSFPVLNDPTQTMIIPMNCANPTIFIPQLILQLLLLNHSMFRHLNIPVVDYCERIVSEIYRIIYNIHIAEKWYLRPLINGTVQPSRWNIELDDLELL
jgi:hypothetical protein